MKFLDRRDVDSLVRELEAGAYGLARAERGDAERADALLLEAFTNVAPWFPRSQDAEMLRQRLHGRIRQRTAPLAHRNGQHPTEPVAIDDSLHARIVDLVEEHQSDEPLGQRKAVLGAIAGVAIVSALVALVWTRFDALTAARPTLTDMTPPPNATEVATQGDLVLNFGRKPSAKPSIRLQPADGVLDSPSWDGKTLAVSYRGLRLATTYSIVVAADYRSRFQDAGHFEQRWSFTTEGYPVLRRVTPLDGAATVFRNGQLSIEFNHRPPVEPRVSLVPGGSTLSGVWNGSVWTVPYTGLAPLTWYRASLVVDYGVPRANIHYAWTFLTEPGPPPAGVPVMWYSTSSPWARNGDPVRLVALDWAGNLVGTLYQAGPVAQSADGSTLSTQDGRYIDRSGMTMGRDAGSYPGFFADDGRSICQLAGPTGTNDPSGALWLFVGPINGSPRRVALAGQAGARSGPAILACSVLNDRAVLMDSGPGGTYDVHVVSLSSGRLIYQRTYAAQSSVWVLSSRDGRYLAEQTQNYGAPGQTTTAYTIIRRTSDGAVMARLDNRRVVRFSWDGGRVITGPMSADIGVNEIDLVDWRTGKTLWRLPSASNSGSDQAVFATAQPNGADMMLARASQPGSGALDQLWLVHPDGTVAQLLNETFYPLFASSF